MKITKWFFLALAFHSAIAQAEEAAYSAQDVAIFQAAVFKALNTDESTLRDSRLKYSANSLQHLVYQTDFTAYGKTPAQAEFNSSMLCMRYMCENLPSIYQGTASQWQNESPGQIMEETQSTGFQDSLPPEVKNDPDALKKYLLNKSPDASTCEKPEKSDLRTFIYVSCVGAGFVLEKK